jgi:hypothetical protein
MGSIRPRYFGLKRGFSMWIFTTSGFVSAVRNPNDRTIIVRSRDHASLVQISKQSGVKISQTPLADYPYRIEIGHDQFVSWISQIAGEIDYFNFKNEVATTRGKRFASALTKVWSTMHDA